MRKKILAIGLVVAMIFSLAACGGTEKAEFQYADTTISGQVTEIDGSTITLEINSFGAGGSAPGGAPPSDNNSEGTPPNGMNPGANENAGGNSSGSAVAPPDKSEDSESSGSGINSEAGGTPPDGMNPGSNGNGQNSQTAVLTINDESIIKKSSDSSDNSGDDSGDDDSDESASLDDIKEGSTLEVKFDKDGSISAVTITENNSQGGNSAEDSGSAANTFDSDETEDSGNYSSTGEDENAVRAESKANVTLTNATVKKTGESSNSDSSAFYGMNAGVLNRDGATLALKKGTVTTNAGGANGVFSYGEGSSATIEDVTINTSKDNSGGVEVAGGGTIKASNLTISTKGKSSAAIRSDRGGGTLDVTGGTYSTSGTGSPAVYSTAEVSVKNGTLNATASEAIVVEGKNSVSITDCNITGNMAGTYGEDSSENIQNVMIYQSMSGDADEGTGRFSMEGGSLTAKNGDMFYVTNTQATIDLENVKLKNADGNLLTVSGNDGSRGWGTKGSNGGDCDFSVEAQELQGNIEVDSISTLNFELSDESSFTGSINSKKQAGDVSVTLSKDSTWTLTGDSYITEFDGDSDNIKTNGYSVYVDGEKLV